MWIDSHCHLTSDSFKEDFEAVLQRADAAQVKSFVVIGAGYGLKGNEAAVKLAESSPKFYATVGIHPHDASKVEEGYLEQLKRWASHPKVAAIGEIGLDYHYLHSPKEVQKERFREQIGLAKKLDLPIIVHTREAWVDTLSVIEEVGPPPRGGVFHCFSEGPEEAKRVIEMGFYISIAGVVTFKKPGKLISVIETMPLERILIETDAPYLAPVPHRGKRNEPAFVALVGEKIAEIRKEAVGHVARVTTQNAKTLFGIV